MVNPETGAVSLSDDNSVQPSPLSSRIRAAGHFHKMIVMSDLKYNSPAAATARVICRLGQAWPAAIFSYLRLDNISSLFKT